MANHDTYSMSLANLKTKTSRRRYRDVSWDLSYILPRYEVYMSEATLLSPKTQIAVFNLICVGRKIIAMAQSQLEPYALMPKLCSNCYYFSPVKIQRQWSRSS